MNISGFLTQARHRLFQTQGPYTPWSDTQHLLGGIHERQEEPPSVASSASDMSSSMRERVDSSVTFCESADIRTLPNLGKFRVQLIEIFAEASAELSDSNAPQYYGLSEWIGSFRAETNPSVEKLAATAMKLTTLLSVSSRFYQQEGRSRSLQTNALALLTRLTETTKHMLKSSIDSSSVMDNVRLAYALSSSSKAWLQYQLGDSTCLATLNNAKNTLEFSDSLNQEPKFLAKKNEALSMIKTWLAIFQLDEKFCPGSSPIHSVRAKESLRLLRECLPLLETARKFSASDERLSENRTAFEILIADTMLKINELVTETGTNKGFFTIEQIMNTMEPLYDFNSGLIKNKQLSCEGILGLIYLLTKVNAILKTGQPCESSYGLLDEKTVLRLQGSIIRIFKEDGAIVPDIGINENRKAKAKYARDLFSSMNKGNSHWMNLVACSRDTVFQFNELMPTIDRSQAKAMF